MYLLMGSFDWMKEGQHVLPLSNVQLDLPPGYLMITGKDAQTFSQLVSVDAAEQVEAVVFHENFESYIFFLFNDRGFVSLDGWDEIDSNALLEAISRHIDKTSVQMKEAGIPPVRVKEWKQQPQLDRDARNVTMAITLQDIEDASCAYCSYGIHLGRKGYLGLSWLTKEKQYNPSRNDLEIIMKGLSFQEGDLYEDYEPGDTIADGSIAHVVASIAGAEHAPPAGSLFLSSKFWASVIGGIVGVGYVMQKTRGGRAGPHE